MATRIITWLKQSKTPFSLLGCVLQNYMEVETENQGWIKGRQSIATALAKYGFVYEMGGRIGGAPTGAPSRSLDAIIRARDMPGVQEELDRALATVERDPPAAVTAACAIIESLFKVYIDGNRLKMPGDQSIRPLWKVVQEHLGLGPRSVVTDDLKQILGGLATVVNGVGDLRTHAGSAHGRGSQSFTVEPRHARLAVHAAHTVVTFILESWAPSRPAERMDATL
jgi:Abortive infection C-terminus